MTSGIQTVGTFGSGYYKERSWNGADGSHGDEHNYAYNIRECYYPKVQYKPYPEYPLWLDGSMNIFSPLLPQLATDKTVALVNCATNKIFVDLAQSNFNAGVFGGEFKESYVMICSLVTRLARGISAIKSGRFQQALHILSPKGEWTGVAANSYMVTHFGLIPLTQDIIAAYEFMVHNYRTIKRARRKCVWKDDALLTSNGVQWRWKAVAIAEIRGEVSMVELSPLDRLSLNDIPSVMWELTKFSWLVDWICPIGNFLAALNASNRTSGTMFAVTRMQRESLEAPTNFGRYPIKGFDAASYDKFFNPGGCNSRAVMSGLPWKFPTVTDPLGDKLSRWVTATALLRQVAGH